MAFSSKTKAKYKIRSISLPCRSHPSAHKLEVELNKIKSCENSSSCAPNAIATINGISQLEGLYKCFGGFSEFGINPTSPIHHHQCDMHIDDIQDKFMSLLDICDTAKDFMSQMKGNCRDIQYSLRRRRKADQSDIEGIVAKYSSYRKKMKKDATNLVIPFKQIDNRISTTPILELDQHVSSIIRVLREVVKTTTSVFQLVLLFFCAPIPRPKRRWSMVSNLLHKRSVTSEDKIEELNELQILNKALDQLCKSDCSELGDGHKVKLAQDRAKTLVVYIEEIENRVECLFRELIRTRAYLLNIGSSLL